MDRKAIRILLLGLCLALGTPRARAGDAAYVFSYFVGDGRDGLHLACSRDGRTWTALNSGRSLLVPTVGKDRLMRDPSVCRGPDGTFHMVWTTGWTDRAIGYASSPDLLHWGEQREIPVMAHEPEARNCWAPEIFYDEESAEFYVIWATTIPGRHSEVPAAEGEKGLNHRIYCVTTRDFETFSPTRMFFDPDFSVIDAAIVRDPGKGDLVMVVKNENSLPAEKNLRVTRSADIGSGFSTDVSPPITGDHWCEGPSPLFVGDTLYVYFDMYRDHRYGAVRSLDHGATWEDVSDEMSFPEGMRHGTALRVDVDVVEALEGARRFNPVIPDHIADPSVCKFDGTYYLYGTTDLGTGLSAAGVPVAWKSRDFVNWSFEGPLIEGMDWGRPHAYVDADGNEREGFYRYWAPGKVVFRDGKYRLLVTIVKPDDDMQTYLMLSDSPDGPFRFAASGASDDPLDGLDASRVAPDIDGEPFIDTDGTPYVFWRHRRGAMMSGDMRGLVGDTATIATARTAYSEGPLMFKRNGIYYYVYTLDGHQNYAYAYMMGRTSPLDGFDRPDGNDIFLFSSIANDVWGPGHGNVFHDEDSDEYVFLYLEYGEGGTTRRVFANRMEFNPDGTIRTMEPDKWGVGYLADPQETRPDKALGCAVTSSSAREPMEMGVDIETCPNDPLPGGGSRLDVGRRRDFLASNAVDGTNAECWMAADDDASPWIMADLGAPTRLEECRMAFVQPTGGHAWRLEASLDGVSWETCALEDERRVRSPHVARVERVVRFLRLHVDEGKAGLWQWNMY